MKDKSSDKPAFGWPFWIVLALIFLLVIIFTLPTIINGRAGKSKVSCLSNLMQIDSAKNQWALQNKKLPTDVPADSDIYGATLYIRALPLCPQGGTYTMNAVSVKPTCSKGGKQHTF